MAYRLIFGECECCGKPNRVLHPTVFCGMDVAPCAPCQYAPLSDDADDIADEIERLLPLAESGEQHAHICALEAAYVEATGEQVRFHP